jgi:hypothetical protein
MIAKVFRRRHTTSGVKAVYLELHVGQACYPGCDLHHIHEPRACGDPELKKRQLTDALACSPVGCLKNAVRIVLPDYEVVSDSRPV